MQMKNAVFNEYADYYDHWFETHPGIYAAQLALLRHIIPRGERILDVGAGSGRFTSPLGIHHGIDPSPALLVMARQRGVETVLGLGEFLPYRAGTFDGVLMMTVICFFKDLDQAFREAYRVIRPGGKIVIGFFEKDGKIALQEKHRKPAGRFLRYATFRYINEVSTALDKAGFVGTVVVNNQSGFCTVTAQKE